MVLMRPMMPRRLRFCFLCCFLLVAAAAAAASGHVVTTLPGFEGRLPFHLETGYVGVDEDAGAELFYYFVQSESGAAASDDTPLLLWLNGGERCSVLSALVYEIGPIRFVVEPYNGTLPRLRYDPNSWTKVAHILFVDSPVGAGFSFSRDPKGYNVGEISSSLQLHKFLSKWFNEHPEYLANPFYIGGESYCGKTVPFLAQMISEGVEAGMKSEPNLKGYLVGNPSTGESIDAASRVPYAHGFGIISHQLYETISGHCRGEDYSNPANELCAQALNTFNDLISQVQQAHVLLDQCVFTSSSPLVLNGDSKTDDGGSASDGRKIKVLREDNRVWQLFHPPARTPFSCFYYRYYLSYFWANDRRTRDALGIKEGTVDEWVRCHDAGELPYERDLKSVIKYHRNLTSRGYRALVFSGDHDLLVPRLGTQTWVRSLNFSVVDDWRAWHLGGQSAGSVMDRSEWMYGINRVCDPRYLTEVRKFIAAAKTHRENLKRTTTICPCSHCKNKKAYEDGTVQSHLIRFGFVEDYTVWTLHGEKRVDVSGVSASSGVSSASTTAPVPPSTAAAPAANDNITAEDILQDMADGGDGGGDGEVVKGPEDVQLFEDLVNHIDENDVVFGNPKWLESSREMKKASVDPLYQDGGSCPKECTTLRFNLTLLMMKARHGWSDNSFNELLSYLGTQRLTLCLPIPIGQRSLSGQWR